MSGHYIWNLWNELSAAKADTLCSNIFLRNRKVYWTKNNVWFLYYKNEDVNSYDWLLYMASHFTIYYAK